VGGVRLFGMGILLLLVVVILVGWAALATSLFILKLLFLLVAAGLVGWAADAVVPGKLPGGWVGAVLAGLVGGVIGGMLFAALGIHDPGFALFGVDLIPAFVGAVIITALAEMFSRRRSLA
jgi:uncharacterized membrane protein YeaQ/YmgE (transglycosylase-associated protein family)